ncbi:MAG: S-layer homology domain-containing protein [Tissierellia bacterium]|nr:S-layer homology domain-containing protein [Tissierellia bacterium]
MKMTNKILRLIITLIILLNTRVVFATTDSQSYAEGYDAGYDFGQDNDDYYEEAKDAYNYYYNTRAHRNIKKDLGAGYDKDEFEEGFFDGFDVVFFKNQKIYYATELGDSLGQIYGAKDYHDGEKFDWRDALPRDREIRNMFNLGLQSKSYGNSFIDEFIDAFKEGYAIAYERAMFEPDKVALDQGISDGQVIGSIVGAASGTKDYFQGLNQDHTRSLSSKDTIISEYTLSNFAYEYQDAFISGYYTGYTESYYAKYNGLSESERIEKLISEIIPISGGTVISADGSFAVTIEPGTYYHDVNLNINTSCDAGNKQSGTLIKSSDSYNLSILNTSGNVSNSKPITISFEYYGDKLKGGIYRLEDYKWLYIPTKIEDGIISAEIKASNLNQSATSYSIFVDPHVMVFPDARGHWAKDEIDTFVRRNLIYGYIDMTFRPDKNISRAEFLTLLSRVYNWNTNYYRENLYSFEDANSFGNFSNIINYALSNNYISGYSDGTFKPNNPISYSEVEIIMNRIIGYGSFRWIDIANNMLYKQKIRSHSFNSMNNKITRAEVVYMLYDATE